MRLAKLRCRDGLELDGLLALPDGPCTDIVIHVHGKCGNFYQNVFISVMAEEYPKHGIGFMSFNNRGHDLVAEAYRHGEICYVGGSREHVGEVDLDLDAFIEFARDVAPEGAIVLQGHSFGCDKVLRYLKRRASTSVRVVFISPADSRAIQEQFGGCDLEAQARAIDQTTGLSDDGNEQSIALLMNAYGVATEGASYPIPIEPRALQDLFHSGAFDSFSSLALPVPDVPCFVLVGSRDELLTLPVDGWLARLKAILSCPDVLLADTDHHFHGQEHMVVEHIIEWVHRQ